MAQTRWVSLTPMAYGHKGYKIRDFEFNYLSLAPVSQSSCLALVDRLAGPVSIEEKALLIL